MTLIFKKIILIILVGQLLFISAGCHHWTEKGKMEFEKKCSQTDTFPNLQIEFRIDKHADGNGRTMEYVIRKLLLSNG